jgi:hypothetical protein
MLHLDEELKPVLKGFKRKPNKQKAASESSGKSA